MITIDPIARAFVPVSSAAADAIGAPNYDEFQSDEEVWELVQQRPQSILRVTMPHCDVPMRDLIEEDGSGESLERARANLSLLAEGGLVREVREVLWVYEIVSPERPQLRQVGLGGMGRTAEIRTPQNPGGTIIRNEGVRESKARGRAQLQQATGADLGTVNNAVDDASGALRAALEAHADAGPCTFECVDETGSRHRVWLVEDAETVGRLRALLAREPRAYVADGNHRSAAAAMLGYEHFLTVFFPAGTMTIAPYNRLVSDTGHSARDVRTALERTFDIDDAPVAGPYQPQQTHEIGLYEAGRWSRLRPKAGTFDATDAARDIDADIVQRHLFAEVLGIADARDERLTFVGANRDAAWLQAEVDAGRFRYAVTLPPVTMRQFIDVCLQDKLMPPKSTWFVPKIRSGLVIALM